MNILTVLVLLIGISAGLTWELVSEGLDKVHMGLGLLVSAGASVTTQKQNNSAFLACEGRVLAGQASSSQCPSYQPGTPQIHESVSLFSSQSLVELLILFGGFALGFGIRFAIGSLRTQLAQPAPDTSTKNG